jgi:hypothetical protein
VPALKEVRPEATDLNGTAIVHDFVRTALRARILVRSAPKPRCLPLGAARCLEPGYLFGNLRSVLQGPRGGDGGTLMQVETEKQPQPGLQIV